MAFMLGSLTNGMFGAMNDVMSFGKNLQEYRQTEAMQKAEKEIPDGSKGGVALPTIQNNTAPGGGSMDRHDDENNVGKLSLDKDVPQPKHLASIPGFGPSAREHDNSAVPTKETPMPAGTDATTPNTAGGGAATNPGALPITSVGPKQTAQPSAELGNGYNPSTGTWQGAPTGTPAVRNAAPNYLPTPANPSGGQPQTGFRAVFGANHPAPGHANVAQAAPVANGPGTVSSNQGAYGAPPTLASGQSGLGAQMMAALNPTTGAVA